MVSGTLYHESDYSFASNHNFLSSVDMDVVVVTINSFVTSILAVVSVPSMSSKDTSHGLVLSQIASSVRCALNSSLTILLVVNDVW